MERTPYTAQRQLTWDGATDTSAVVVARRVVEPSVKYLRITVLPNRNEQPQNTDAYQAEPHEGPGRLLAVA